MNGMTGHEAGEGRRPGGFVCPKAKRETAMAITLSTINIATQKTTVEAEFKALIAGINSQLPDETSFVINGTTWARADLVAQLQSRIDAAEATKNARTSLHTAVSAEQATQLKIAPLRAGFKTYLQGRFGKSSAELQLFGFTPNKTPQKTAQTKADAVAKAKATRKARGTAGKKQKSQIHGTAPATAPAASPSTTPTSPAVTTPATTTASHS
jgi:hypothetical protein